MTPEQIAKAGTEHANQTALFAWSVIHVGKHPELKWLHAIKNEERSGNIIAGARAKQSGIKKGVSDIFLPVRRGNFSGLYIELKKPSLKPKRNGKGGVSEKQAEFGEFVQSQGFGFCVCYGWEEAAKIIIQYLEQK
jgi:hypothetical protein